MILPTENLHERDSLLGVGAVVLQSLTAPRTVTQLWSRLRQDPSVATYERFILALVLLYILGAIHFDDDRIHRATR